MEDKLLAAIASSEARLLVAIKAGDARHDVVHEAMRAAGVDRHRRIDDFIKADAEEDAMSAGRRAERSQIVATLRYLNEFRWIWLPLIVGLLLLTNNVGLSLTTT